MQIDSDFAILDVKKGRKKLAKRIAAGETFRVQIEAEINHQHSADDGVSIEFQMRVDKLEVLS